MEQLEVPWIFASSHNTWENTLSPPMEGEIRKNIKNVPMVDWTCMEIFQFLWWFYRLQMLWLHPVSQWSRKGKQYGKSKTQVSPISHLCYFKNRQPSQLLLSSTFDIRSNFEVGNCTKQQSKAGERIDRRCDRWEDYVVLNVISVLEADEYLGLKTM